MRKHLLLFVVWTCTIPTALAAQSEAESQDLPVGLGKAPSVERVKKRAVELYSYDESADRWSSRARWSHLLPTLKSEMYLLDQRDLDVEYEEQREVPDENKIRKFTEDEHGFEQDTRYRRMYSIELKWKLRGLTFSRDEFRAAKEARQQREERIQLLDRVTKLYFVRRQKILSWQHADRKNSRERSRLVVEIRRLNSKLDNLTDNWFSDALR